MFFLLQMSSDVLYIELILRRSMIGQLINEFTANGNKDLISTLSEEFRFCRQLLVCAKVCYYLGTFCFSIGKNNKDI